VVSITAAGLKTFVITNETAEERPVCPSLANATATGRQTGNLRQCERLEQQLWRRRRQQELRLAADRATGRNALRCRWGSEPEHLVWRWHRLRQN
jgi:hypothetical protein